MPPMPGLPTSWRGAVPHAELVLNSAGAGFVGDASREANWHQEMRVPGL